MNAQNAIEIAALGGYKWGGNYTVETAKIQIKNNGTFGMVLDFPVPETPGLMAEIAYSYSRSNLTFRELNSLQGPSSFEMDIHYFLAGGTYQENLGQFIPFAIGQIGAVLFHSLDSGYNDAWMFAASIGMGAKTKITSTLGFRLQGRFLVPIQIKEGALWCQSGSGCAIFLKSGTILLQGDVMAGIYIQL
jgi:hypothetical protein